jgi:DNA-directed RNA polymerase specialized sigma24 family protein
VTPDDHSIEDHRDARELERLAELLEKDPASPEANRLIAELIVGWRRLYEPWLVLKAGRQIADPVVSTVELRLMILLRRKQQFPTSWRTVVWFTVRKELASERRRLAKRGKRETAVEEVFGQGAEADEPSHSLFDGVGDDPEYDIGRLRRARAKLSADDQEVLRLLFEENLGREDAAKRLGIARGTLNTRRFRALERLEKAWNEDDGEDV